MTTRHWRPSERLVKSPVVPGRPQATAPPGATRRRGQSRLRQGLARTRTGTGSTVKLVRGGARTRDTLQDGGTPKVEEVVEKIGVRPTPSPVVRSATRRSAVSSVSRRRRAATNTPVQTFVIDRHPAAAGVAVASAAQGWPSSSRR